MRIAVLTNDYPPNARGGAGVIAVLQVQELEKRGHTLRVWTCSDVRRPPNEPPPTWRTSDVRRAFSRLFFHLQDLAPRSELVTEIVDWKPDILLTHNLMGCGIGTPNSIQSKGIPWVHMLHDVQLIDPSGQIVKGESFALLWIVWRAAASLVRRRTIGRPTSAIFPTHWLLDFHRKYGFFSETQCVVIPNPSNSDIPTSDVRQFSDVGRRRGVVFAGRVSEDKGVLTLMDGWKMMGDSRPPLTIVGDGSLRARLESMTDERLSVLGQQPHDRVLDLMRESRVVVVPSLVMENQPTVILDALASGCRVVASDVGGIPETLGSAGWIVPAGEANALALAIKDALNVQNDPSREKARVDILAHHGVDVVMDALESLLKSNL